MELKKEVNKESKPKKKKWKIILTVIGIIVAVPLILAFFIPGFLITFILMLFTFGTEKEITTDIAKYNEVIVGEKWGMSEEIFPESIVDLNVVDFKHVYYNPWDANYLCYLVVDYDDAEYKKEVERLNEIGIEDYKGYYSVTGFENHDLLAMDSDSYQGFIYAIKGEGNQIIYVELVFCNYFMDIEYEAEIPLDYLPNGFNAKLNNPYQKLH